MSNIRFDITTDISEFPKKKRKRVASRMYNIGNVIAGRTGSSSVYFFRLPSVSVIEDVWQIVHSEGDWNECASIITKFADTSEGRFARRLVVKVDHTDVEGCKRMSALGFQAYDRMNGYLFMRVYGEPNVD